MFLKVEGESLFDMKFEKRVFEELSFRVFLKLVEAFITVVAYINK